jgi:hypothetical protein
MYMGDLCIFKEDLKRTRTVICVAHSELLVIHRSTIQVLMTEFPKLSRYYDQFKNQIDTGTAAQVGASVCQICGESGHSELFCPNSQKNKTPLLVVIDQVKRELHRFRMWYHSMRNIAIQGRPTLRHQDTRFAPQHLLGFGWNNLRNKKPRGSIFDDSPPGAEREQRKSRFEDSDKRQSVSDGAHERKRSVRMSERASLKDGDGRRRTNKSVVPDNDDPDKPVKRRTVNNHPEIPTAEDVSRDNGSTLPPRAPELESSPASHEENPHSSSYGGRSSLDNMDEDDSDPDFDSSPA